MNTAKLHQNPTLHQNSTDTPCISDINPRTSGINKRPTRLNLPPRSNARASSQLALKLSCFGVLAILASHAHISTAQDTKNSPLQALYNCAEITNDADRLACYDKETGFIRQAEEKQDIITVEKEDIVQAKRDSFGLTLPKLPSLDLDGLFTGDNETAVKEQRDTITNLRKVGRKGLEVTLENGQVWKVVTGSVDFIPRGDLISVIKPAALGSYLMRIETPSGTSKLRGLRVSRVK